MSRRVLPEWLDRLPADDPRAQRSRRDLRRINAWMGNARHLAGMLRSRLPASREATAVGPPVNLMDLGAGDGHVTLGALRRLPRPAAGSRLLLVDQQPVVSHATLQSFRAHGWAPTIIAEDVVEALRRPPEGAGSVGVANLFLHHFETPALRRLLELVAVRSVGFIACEPRRSALARWSARLLWVIACNGVTRHDARVSVEAGFRSGEWAAHWPDSTDWELTEQPVGLFSQLLVAWKRGGGGPV